MKISLISNVIALTRPGDGSVLVELKSVKGEVEKVPVSSKSARLTGTLALKEVVADQLKFGDKFKITIEISDGSDEDNK